MNRIVNFIKHKKWVVVLLCVLCSTIPIVCFIWKFRRFSLSDNPADWGVFGDYVGGIYGGFFSCVVMVLAIYIARALSKKDQRQVKVSAAAEKLYKQICTIENNGYNLNSINKFVRDINENELYFSDNEFIKQLRNLYDQFVEQNGGTGTVDMELKNYIMAQLKVYYGQ